MGVHDGLSKMGTGPGYRPRKTNLVGKLIFDSQKKIGNKEDIFKILVSKYDSGWYVEYKDELIQLSYDDVEYVEMFKDKSGSYMLDGTSVTFEIDNHSPKGYVMGQEQYSSVPQMTYGKSAKISPSIDSYDNYYENEIKKCTNSPYYYMTRYFTINNNRFTTSMSEEEFNDFFYKQIVDKFTIK